MIPSDQNDVVPLSLQTVGTITDRSLSLVHIAALWGAER